MKKDALVLSSSIRSVGAYLAHSTLSPASVQRTFLWENENTSALLNDLLRAWRAAEGKNEEAFAFDDPPETGMSGSEAAEEGDQLGFSDAYAQIAPSTSDVYFLGAMVLEPQSEGHLLVFDGLQRSTALVVLFSVIRDLMPAGSVDIREALDACINIGKKPRLSLATRIDTLAADIQKRGEAVRIRRNFIGHKTLRGRLLRAAALFRDNLRKLNEKDLKSFADFLYDNVWICEIRVGSPVLARQIFVTTNDRGLSLNQADVFKSQLASIATSEEAADQILERWKSIDAVFENKEQFIDFLSAADFLTRRRWPSGGGLTDLGDHLIAKMDEAAVFDWLDKLQRYQEAWRLLYSVRSPRANQVFGGDLLRLHFFPWPEWRPLALVLLEAWQAADRNDSQQRAARVAGWIKNLHRSCMAMVLSGMGEAARQAAFGKAVTLALRLADPAGTKGPLHLTPDQRNRLQHALVSPIEDPDVARQLIRWYESLLWGIAPPPYLLAKTIEHVLPRARDAGNDWSRAFSDEAIHRRMSHMIGNFTLLDYDLNERAGRLSFERKKGVYREEPHEIRSLISVCSEPEWTPLIIERRTQEMNRTLGNLFGILN